MKKQVEPHIVGASGEQWAVSSQTSCIRKNMIKCNVSSDYIQLSWEQLVHDGHTCLLLSYHYLVLTTLTHVHPTLLCMRCLNIYVLSFTSHSIYHYNLLFSYFKNFLKLKIYLKKKNFASWCFDKMYETAIFNCIFRLSLIIAFVHSKESIDLFNYVCYSSYLTLYIYVNVSLFLWYIVCSNRLRYNYRIVLMMWLLQHNK